MARWKQVYDKETGTSTFVPIDNAARLQSAGASIHGDITPFVSPVDGSVITDRKQLREHNKRNNVVNADEFSPEFYERKARERTDFYEGRHTKKEKLARKQEIWETMHRLERNGA